MYPNIYLAIDNCFAAKRLTRPEQWCRAIRELGLRYVQASADVELDPLYMGAGYLTDWVSAVREACANTGVTIANLYSGHGTYTTLGITHTDPRVRRRLIDHWFKPMIDTAAALGAGLGFFAHAFPHDTIDDPALYSGQIAILEDALIEINRYAAARSCGPVSIEQMYTPHQYPYTIAQTQALLRAVTKRSGRAFYFTEDVGHHTPLYQRGQDADCYAWLERLGRYAPIIHLQQTDGRSSAHLPFTSKHNVAGIIEPLRVLRALKAAYDSTATGAAGPPDPAMPLPCAAIYLTLEIFTPTTAALDDTLADLAASAAFWRAAVPRDGMSLDELV